MHPPAAALECIRVCSYRKVALMGPVLPEHVRRATQRARLQGRGAGRACSRQMRAVVCASSMMLTPPARDAVPWGPPGSSRICPSARCAANSEDEHAVSVETQGPCGRVEKLPGLPARVRRNRRKYRANVQTARRTTGSPRRKRFNLIDMTGTGGGIAAL